TTGACTAPVANTSAKGFEIIIDSPAPDSKLKRLDTLSMSAEMVMGSNGHISNWICRGELANQLGISE
ncbi:MAG: hypothetical protein OEL55_02270, partial [Desulfobulbaceae bacterium]|nr:hypothetical protein [Desulfobulbaceae bacterium]